METPVYIVDPSASEAKLNSVLSAPARLLADNHVVAFPTETVYGLGGNAWSDAAIGKIYTAKGRPSDNPLIVHVASMEQCRSLVAYMPAVAERLANAFWPGPLTMVLRKKGPISARVTAGLETVAIRMPSHPVALALIRLSGVPIAAPSANLSGKPSPTTALHVHADLAGRISGIVDGGPTGVGLESTVVDCSQFPPPEAEAHSDGKDAKDPKSGASVSATVAVGNGLAQSQSQQPVEAPLKLVGGPLVILRPGGVTKEMLERVVGSGNVQTDTGAWGSHAKDPAAALKAEEQKQKAEAMAAVVASEPVLSGPKAPGMKYTHYAPRAPLFLVRGSDAYLQKLVDAATAEAKLVGVLTTEEKLNTHAFRAHKVIACGRRSDLASVAHALYDSLRAFDATSVDVIYGEVFPDSGLGDAIMNRLEKAAGGRLCVEQPA